MVLFKSYDLPQYIFNQDPNALVNCNYVPRVKGNQPYIQDGNIPAWSLHRLIEILDSPLIEFNQTFNPYEEIIDLISGCLKLKCITNKEYLKQ